MLCIVGHQYSPLLPCRKPVQLVASRCVTPSGGHLDIRFPGGVFLEPASTRYKRYRRKCSMGPAAGAIATPAWFAEECMMGIDEAGRGPVLGPMVYGCAYCSKRQKAALAERAFADSKTLTEEKREALFEEIAEDANMGSAVDTLDARTISAQMLHSQKESLNVMANNSTFRLIEGALELGVNIREVYVDTVGEASRHQQRLSERFPGIEFTVCPKADAIYPIVSAASIVAKVTRDRQLRDHLFEDGWEVTRDTGSGYPGDPITKSWLKAHMDTVFGFPSLVRFSWATCKTILDASAVPVKWECDEELEDTRGQQQLSFARDKAAKAEFSSGAGRHSLYRANRLQRVAQF